MSYVPDKSGGRLAQIAHESLFWLRRHAQLVSRWVWAIFLVIVLAVIGFQVVVNWEQVRAYPWQWDIKYIFLGFLAYSVSLLVTATIWALVIGRISGMRAVRMHIRLYSLTNLAQRLPTLIPFVGARVEAYAARGVPRTATLTAMSLEVSITVVGALVTAILSMPYGFPESLGRLNVIAWVLLLPLIYLVLRPSHLIRILNRIFIRLKREPIQATVRTQDSLLWVGLFSLVWMNGGVVYYFLTHSIYPLSPDQIPVLVNVFAISGVIGWLGQLFFIVPNLALRQVAVAYLLSFSVPLPVAIAVAVLTRLSVMVFELLWALFFGLIERSQRYPLRKP